jgi:hypothetical protein
MARKFIFETDWFTDCDDCVALRLLSRNLDNEHELLGVNVNACSPFAYPSLRAFMENEGVDCPVGLDFCGKYNEKTLYQERMAKDSKFTNADALDSLDFYKKILEENDDVEIISVGFLCALQRVFSTYPELIKKVKKIWIMGGDWSMQGGREYNFYARENPLAMNASQFVVNELPCEITFLGFEVGESVLTGGNLSEEDMLSKALRDWGAPDGRCSWDPMTVMLAFHDKFQGAFEYVVGKASVDENGANYFEKDENGRQAFVVKTKPDTYYQEVINGSL